MSAKQAKARRRQMRGIQFLRAVEQHTGWGFSQVIEVNHRRRVRRVAQRAGESNIRQVAIIYAQALEARYEPGKVLHKTIQAGGGAVFVAPRASIRSNKKSGVIS